MGQRNLAPHDPTHDATRPCPSRRPLSDSAAAGNIKHPVLASNDIYHDNKGPLLLLDKKVPCASRDEPCANCEMGYGVNCIYQNQSHDLGYNMGYPMGMDRGYGVPVVERPHPQFVPSQRASRLRRKAGSKRRTRNPIADSVHYQQYRSRQTKDGDVQKWPDFLEDLFLDAIMAIPPMGRRKYSFENKPHGRNELISTYLWIGYVKTLPRGVEPDAKMRRTRKQVSSHIQVLKGFMKDHPQFDRLFPSGTTAANGFEDSFKNDKTLRALSQGRLPTRDYEEEDSQEHTQPLHLKPSSFEMFVSHSESEFHKPVRIHDYSTLCSRPLNGSKESINVVRDRFPQLAELEATNSLPSCIIHLDVGISLTKERLDGAELNTRVFLQVNPHQQTKWKTLTTLEKPKCLRGAREEPPIYKKLGVADCSPDEDGSVKLHISFPAHPWAHAFIQLIDLHDDSLLDTITMYQEIHSSTSSHPFTRRAILLWTFHKSPDNTNGETTWNYIGTPSRNDVFSPSINEPQPQHTSIHSILQPQAPQQQDSFSNSWDDHMSNNLTGNLIDPFTTVGNYAAPTGPPPLLRSPFEGGFGFGYEGGIGGHVEVAQQNGMGGFDGNGQVANSLDIQLSYEAVGALEGFNEDRNPFLMTPTPGGVGVGVVEGFDAHGLDGEHGGWTYDGLNGVGVGGWDDGGDLGVGVGGYHHGGGGNISVGTN